jgi:hypothetical protein
MTPILHCNTMPCGALVVVLLGSYKATSAKPYIGDP